MPTAPPLPAPAPVDGARAAPAAAAILATGFHLPEGILRNGDLEAMVDTSDAWIMERTGIRERRRAGSGETVSLMGSEAARAALDRAGDPTPDLVICATCTPDTLLPSAACLIQRRLGLPPGVAAFDLNAACSGFVYGMAVARSLIVGGTARTVLLVAAEALTTLVDYGDRSTCVLFGDGAAAAVVGGAGGGGIAATSWGADGHQGELIYYGPSQDDGESGDAIRMLGKGTFRMAVEHICRVASELCDQAGWSPADVDHFVPHQANLRIVEASAKRLGIPMERCVVNVGTLGNTSAASIPLALAQADAAGRFHDGDRVVSVAFGAGVTWGGFALEWKGPSRS